MKLLSLIFVAICAFGQSGPSVNQVAGPPPNAVENLLFYDGNGNNTYICEASQFQQQTYSASVGGSTSLTNIVVLSNVATATFGTAPGLYVGARVTVSASTTSALNGTYTVTSVSGATVLFSTSGVSNGTYSTTGLTVSTNQPRTSQAVWAIIVLKYNASNQLVATGWADTATGYSKICDNRANY